MRRRPSNHKECARILLDTRWTRFTLMPRSQHAPPLPSEAYSKLDTIAILKIQGDQGSKQKTSLFHNTSENTTVHHVPWYIPSIYLSIDQGPKMRQKIRSGQGITTNIPDRSSSSLDRERAATIYEWIVSCNWIESHGDWACDRKLCVLDCNVTQKFRDHLRWSEQ